jgi:hypothetical protein
VGELDLNGHVGRVADEYEGVHGGFGYLDINKERDLILEFSDVTRLVICITWFKKRMNDLNE